MESFFPFLGLLVFYLTGGIGLISGGTVLMFAIKESAIPTIIGGSNHNILANKKPLIRYFYIILKL